MVLQKVGLLDVDEDTEKHGDALPEAVGRRVMLLVVDRVNDMLEHEETLIDAVRSLDADVVRVTLGDGVPLNELLSDTHTDEHDEIDTDTDAHTELECVVDAAFDALEQPEALAVCEALMPLEPLGVVLSETDVECDMHGVEDKEGGALVETHAVEERECVGDTDTHVETEADPEAARETVKETVAHAEMEKEGEVLGDDVVLIEAHGVASALVDPVSEVLADKHRDAVAERDGPCDAVLQRETEGESEMLAVADTERDTERDPDCVRVTLGERVPLVDLLGDAQLDPVLEIDDDADRQSVAVVVSDTRGVVLGHCDVELVNEGLGETLLDNEATVDKEGDLEPLAVRETVGVLELVVHVERE